MAEQFDDQAIHSILSEALLSGRLMAGAKLGEQRLAAVFGVTRERIRKVLLRLGHERLIETFPNRGAYVVNPSIEDAREIYEARRIVEGGIAWRLAECLNDEQKALLRAHFTSERQAHLHNSRADSVRLSGEFHILLARMTGNEFVIRTMQELVARTSMLVAFFEDSNASECAVEEHEEILLALENRNPAGAAHAMMVHLALIETRLHPRAAPPGKADLLPALKEAIDAYLARTAGTVRGARPGSGGPRRRKAPDSP